MEKTRPAGGRPTVERAAAIGSAVRLATWDAVATHGTDFSMDQVALLAGVSKQTIYRRWASKHALILDTVETTLDDYLRVAVPVGADPMATMRMAIWTQYFDKDLAAWDRVSVFLHAMSLRDPVLRRRLVHWHGRFRGYYVALLQAIDGTAGVADTAIETRAELCMELMAGAAMTLAVTSRASEADKRQAFETRWTALCQMVMSSGGPRS